MKTISYREAVNWFNGSIVLCNTIPVVDNSIFDNIRFSLYSYVDSEGNEYDEEPEDIETEEKSIDIYQYFITDFSQMDVEYLEKRFGLLFSYSDALDCFILCVSHWGTSWDGVMIEDRFAEED